MIIKTVAATLAALAVLAFGTTAPADAAAPTLTRPIGCC